MVPPLWLKICGQIGPTGTYNRKSLSAWFLDLLARQKQLKEWSEMSLQLPGSIWIAGLFNPMGYVTACLQVTLVFTLALIPTLDSMTLTLTPTIPITPIPIFALALALALRRSPRAPRGCRSTR